MGKERGRGRRGHPPPPLWVPASAGLLYDCPTPHRHSCESRNPSLAPPPPLGTRVRGYDDAPPSFLRKQESIPGLGMGRPGMRGFRHLPPLGTRVRGHDVVPPSFLRKQESIPGPTSPLWVPASAGTTWFHRHSCESRNPSLGRPSSAPPPPSGYPRPRARRGSTVIPAKAGIHPWPHLPLWVPASAGTTWFHRHSCESRNPSPAPPPPHRLGTRVRGHDVVPPSFLRSLSSWKRGAGIHPWDAGTTRRQHTSSYRSAQNGLSFSIKSTFHARLHLLIAFSLPMALSIDS